MKDGKMKVYLIGIISVMLIAGMGFVSETRVEAKPIVIAYCQHGARSHASSQYIRSGIQAEAQLFHIPAIPAGEYEPAFPVQ